jgi:3-oxoacyl-[acyl-carrier-protein] synthase-3
VFTHQVGRAHRKLLLERLALPPERDYPVVEFLGNTGAAALLGIGSGLSSVMLGLEWHSGDACVVVGD